MAKVLGKTSLLPSVNCNNHRHHNQKGQILLSPRSGTGYGTRSSPRLKIKSLALKTHLYGKQLVLRDDEGSPSSRRRWASRNACKSQMGLIGKTKWWEKGVKPNMKEVESAQDLASSLSNAGDQLVVVHFYSPGCGGCRALHPKICQLAEMNPEVQFLHVNYEEHKSMCCSLNVHVLPFFRFYRGAHGRLCSFSCTNATIKKFKDALAKHGPDRCSIGPTKGLEERELQALAINKDLNFNYTSKPAFSPAQDERLVRGLPLILEPKEAEENILVAGRR